MAEAQTMWLCRCGYLNPGRKPLVYVAGPITGDVDERLASGVQVAAATQPHPRPPYTSD